LATLVLNPVRERERERERAREKDLLTYQYYHITEGAQK
jgi:hypothetical protein